jgi:zinc transport system permease protein
MSEFWGALADPDFPFLRQALIAGLLASVAFGMMGSYVVARRVSYLAGAIAHCVLAGVGASLYAREALGWAWASPMLGTLTAALVAALIMGATTVRGGQRHDTVIVAVWVAGMALGLLLHNATPGYHDLMSYLFGNILLLSPRDVWLIAGLDLALVGIGAALYPKFVALCFDEEFARLRGVRVGALYFLLLCMTALTVVLLLKVVGIVLVIALLVLPAAAASGLARHMYQMIALATLFCALSVTAGLGASYEYNQPAGPAIVLVATGVYLAAAGVKRVTRLLRRT